jgi:hypothetical protein
MLHIPRLIIVAGTGRNVGKTTVTCRIIDNFRNSNITAVKISSHLHEPQYHLKLIFRGESYLIWEELSNSEQKDSSRFLASGATRSFYIQALKQNSVEAFSKLVELLPYSSPMICESPSLATGIEPGVLVIVSGDNTSGETTKDIKWAEGRRALRLTTSQVETMVNLPITLNETVFSFYTPAPTTW